MIYHSISGLTLEEWKQNDRDEDFISWGKLFLDVEDWQNAGWYYEEEIEKNQFIYNKIKKIVRKRKLEQIEK